MTKCNTRFICVGGKAGSGKDHCVGILTNSLEKAGKTIFQTAFADHLKQQCCNVTGIPLHMWHMPSEIKQKDNSALRVVNCEDKFFQAWCVDNKHSVDVPRSMRWWMQHYSDYKKAKHGVNYYIDYVVDVIQEQLEISNPDYVVLTDCRYLSELQQSTNIPNAYSVYVHNPDNVVGVIPENIILGEQHTSVSSLHSHNSEQQAHASVSLFHSHNSEQLTQEAFQHVILNTYSTREDAILQQWREILSF